MAHSVPAVENAIRLLHFLEANSQSQKSLAEACDALGIPRSTGFNIMKTLGKHSFVRFDPESKRYRLGWALVRLGASASEQMDYVEVARPFLRNLGRETGLTCVLAQRVTDHFTFVDKVESSNDVWVTANIGQLYPLSAGAPGKALMAYLGEETVRAYAARSGLPAFTGNAITDVESLLRELADVRRVGFAVSSGEYVEGVNSVAAPVFSASDEVNLAVSALGLLSALPLERSEEFGALVTDIARQITTALGGIWRGPSHLLQEDQAS